MYTETHISAAEVDKEITRLTISINNRSYEMTRLGRAYNTLQEYPELKECSQEVQKFFEELAVQNFKDESIKHELRQLKESL